MSKNVLDSIEEIAYEKKISKDFIFASLEKAIKASYELNGEEVEVSVSRNTGEVSIIRIIEVVDKESDIVEDNQVTLDEAKYYTSNPTVGMKIQDPIEGFSLTRSILKVVYKNLMEDIKSEEKRKEYDEFREKEGHIINGIVKRVFRSNMIVACGRAQAIMYRSGMIMSEKFDVNDKIIACIEKVKRSDKDFQIVLSRTTPKFLVKILEEKVPEINSGVIEIKAIARDPGSRAKIAVWSSDPRLDPVGACIGLSGGRIKSVSDECGGEKIEIMPWRSDKIQFAHSIFQNANPVKIYQDINSIVVVVEESNLSLAIGRGGQSVRMGSQLLESDIDVMSVENHKKKVWESLKEISENLVKHLDIDEEIASILIAYGFIDIEKMIEAGIEELSAKTSISEDICSEIIKRAESYLSIRDAQISECLKKISDSSLIENFGFSDKELCVLFKSGVKNSQDLAYLADDELIEIFQKFNDFDFKVPMDAFRAKNIIMKARSLFDDFGQSFEEQGKEK